MNRIQRRRPEPIRIVRLAVLLAATGWLQACAAAVPAAGPEPEPEPEETAATTADDAPPAWAPAPSSEAQDSEHGAVRWSDLMKAGRTHLEYGELAEAEDRFVRAFDLTADFRPTDPRTTATLKNLERVARAYREAGDVTGFARMMELMSVVSDLDPEARSSELAELTHELATILAAQGRLEESQAALERALALTLETRGPDDPSLVGLHAQLALTRIELDDLAGAEAEIDRAAELAVRDAGEETVLFARSLLPRARLAFVRGDVEGAREAMLAAVEIHEQQFGPVAPATAQVVRELALFEQSAGDRAAARKAFERVIAIWDALPRESYQRAMSRNELAWFLIETGRPALAEAPGRSALAILSERGVGGHALAAVCDTLATALRDQAKYEEAETLYQQALAEGAKSESAAGLDVAEIAERYSVLLEETGRAGEAEALRSRWGSARKVSDS